MVVETSLGKAILAALPPDVARALEAAFGGGPAIRTAAAALRSWSDRPGVEPGTATGVAVMLQRACVDVPRAPEDCIDALRLAAELRSRLVALDPKQAGLASIRTEAWLYVARACLAAGDWPALRDAARAGAADAAWWVDHDPSAPAAHADLGETTFHEAFALAELGDVAEARALYVAALERLRPRAAGRTAHRLVTHSLAQNLEAASLLSRSQGHHAEAESLLVELVVLARRCARRSAEKPNWLAVEARANAGLTLVRATRKDLPGAIQAATAELNARARLQAADPEHRQPTGDLVICMLRRATLLMEAGRSAPAREAYEKLLELMAGAREGIAKAFIEGQAAFGLAYVHRREHELAPARALVDFALACSESLSPEEAVPASGDPDLANWLRAHAQAEEELGDAARARVLWTEALRLLEPRLRVDRSAQLWAAACLECRRALARLDGRPAEDA